MQRHKTHQSTLEHFLFLRERYLSRARAAVLILLQAEKLVAYDKVWSSAMTFPLTLEKDLKDWIHEWELTGQLEIIGMKENQRVPQLGQNVSLMWKK